MEQKKVKLNHYWRIAHLLDHSQGVDVGGKLILHHADVTDSSSINRIDTVMPDEVYNLAAQSHVLFHLRTRIYCEFRCSGVLRCLEAIRRVMK